MYMRAGRKRRALVLFRKSRAWKEGARVALDLGLDAEAAALLRRAGGHNLKEAGRLYRRAGDQAAGQRCDHELAEWHMSGGRYEDAIEPWLRAGEALRAVRAAELAITERRLSPSNPSFAMARKAAEATRDHGLLARLSESAGEWMTAARAWQHAGEHGPAAEAFRRAGALEQAAAEEAAAGRPREAVQLRLRRLVQAHERLHLAHARGGDGEEEARRLELSIGTEAKSLLVQLDKLEMGEEAVRVLQIAGRELEAIQRLVGMGQKGRAAELARESERWGLAAGLMEQMGRWGEASDMWEVAGDGESAARCAERAGEDERALTLHRSLGNSEAAATCLARLGRLQDGLIELHRSGSLEAACDLLREFPGPVPDIPDVVLDMASWARSSGSLQDAIACLQRAVLGVALQRGRLEPALALARFLDEAGEHEVAMAQVDRVLDYDYAFSPAQDLKRELLQQRAAAALVSTQAVDESGTGVTSFTAAAEQRYEIQNELGRGGMGLVYRARDTRLDRDVAIKVLRTTSAEEAARLEQEAQAAATLNHSGIVTVYDFEVGFGGYFIAMEYVPGEPLDRLLRTEPSRVRDNLTGILLQLAEAVSYAHQHRVIHRDLKPGNMLLTAHGQVKILDFGIAARLDRENEASSGVCGTPFYMAPEQIRGEAPTPATDIYAFGTTAFHLATGRPPFARGNVIEAHLKEAPPEPTTLAPNLLPDLAQLILRCLEKDPTDRFQSGVELRDALALLPG